MTLIERLRIAATDDHERGCQGRYFTCTCGYDAATQITCQDAARALEAADALADELEWATRQIAPHKIMCMADDGPACTCDRPQRIKQAIQALAAYRSATKGEG